MIFANILDTSFMGVDEGSITTSINELFIKPYYNMLASYHSKYYGWSYLTINYVFLAPIKLFTDDPVIINFCIRLILFFIGFLSVAILHKLLLQLTKNHTFSLLASLFFILNPDSAHYWYTIHPESTGILFFLFGIGAFLRYLEQKNIKYYFFCIVFLALSSLAKQPFFVMSLPVLLYMLFEHCDWTFKKTIYFITSKKFLILFALTAALAILILFIINPYAILSLKKFIAYQIDIVATHSVKEPLLSALSKWVVIGISSPLIVIQSIITIATLIIIATYKKNRISFLFKYSVFSSTIIMLIFMSLERLYFSATYIAPLYPVFLINLIAALTYLVNAASSKGLKTSINISSTGIFTVIIVSLSLTTFTHILENVLLHTNTTKHLSWDYISKIPIDKKIVYDPNVGIPPQNKTNSCHIWAGCQEKEFLANFAPDYFILYKDYKYLNKEIVFGYMDKNKFCLTDKLIPTTADNIALTKNEINPDTFINLTPRATNLYNNWMNKNVTGEEISIYKKCDQ